MSNNMELGASWEGLVKTLLQRLDMPTKEDINHLHDRLDVLEQLIVQRQSGVKPPPLKRKNRRKSASATALEIIAGYPEGADFKTIKTATGFEDKKLRNIIYRLDALGKIQRVTRGTYKIT
jgi:hypothetical protein